MLEDKVIRLKVTGLKDETEVLSYVSNLLIESGSVKESFKKAVIEREQIFPTGLLFQDYGIAIPHTDTEHVNYSQLAFVSLEKPVKFRQMATGEEIKVDMVLMLALKEAHAQVEMLSQLIEFFQKKDTIHQLLSLTGTKGDEETVINIFKQNSIQ